jgi:integrase
MAWLEPSYKNRTGKICPNGLRLRLEADRKRARITKWPSNALRHSFGSYHLARFENAARTALEMGHQDQNILFAHYRELVSPEAAKQYWSIMPTGSSSLISLPG